MCVTLWRTITHLSLVLGTFCDLASAIQCVDIPDDKALDPNAANGKWTIVDFTKCFTRAQNSKDTDRGGTGQYWDSRVTKTHWTSTAGSVAGTVGDPYNRGGDNDQLWFTGNRHAAEYWGCVKPCGFGSTVQGGIYSQFDGTNGVYTVVSVILPSGVDKLERIDPDPYAIDPNVPDPEAVGARSLGIFGINGDIADSDLAWANMYSVMQGLRARYNTGVKMYQYFYAERTKVDDCVVVDMRNDGLAPCHLVCPFVYYIDQTSYILL